MPTDTFYRLPEEKRQRLKNAIIRELKRVPFSEMSINRIIQAAEIPRGSYYQYFRDREDVLGYVLQEYKNGMIQLARQICPLVKGDGCELFRRLFSHTIQFALAEENFMIFRNIISDLKMGDLLAECSPQMCCGDPSFTDGERRKERLLYEILAALFIDSVARIFANPETVWEIQKDYEEKLNMLQSIREV